MLEGEEDEGDAVRSRLCRCVVTIESVSVQRTARAYCKGAFCMWFDISCFCKFDPGAFLYIYRKVGMATATTFLVDIVVVVLIVLGLLYSLEKLIFARLRDVGCFSLSPSSAISTA